MELTFEKVSKYYIRQFGEEPPVLATLSVDDEEYLRVLLDCIEENNKITMNELAEIFMDDENAIY